MISKLGITVALYSSFLLFFGCFENRQVDKKVISSIIDEIHLDSLKDVRLELRQENFLVVDISRVMSCDSVYYDRIFLRENDRGNIDIMSNKNWISKNESEFKIELDRRRLSYSRIEYFFSLMKGGEISLINNYLKKPGISCEIDTLTFFHSTSEKFFKGNGILTEVRKFREHWWVSK